VLVLDKPFLPSLMFVVKAVAYLGMEQLKCPLLG